MKLIKTVAFDIDIDYIIKEYGLNSNSNLDTIVLAVRYYIAGFDDEYYDLIDNDEDKEKIARVIAEKLNIGEI